MIQVTTDKGRYYLDLELTEELRKLIYSREDTSSEIEKLKPYYSVTTIKSYTDPKSKREALEKWRQAEIEAGRDPSAASKEGDIFHGYLESYYDNKFELPEKEECEARPFQLFEQYNKNFLKKAHIEPVEIETQYKTEVNGYRYAGTIDFLGNVQVAGEDDKPYLELNDHKSIKKLGDASSRIKGYWLQQVAYAKALKDAGIVIHRARINFASTRGFKTFVLSLDELVEKYWKEEGQFYSRLENFYKYRCNKQVLQGKVESVTVK